MDNSMKLKQRFLRFCHILRHPPWSRHWGVACPGHIRCICGEEWD